MSTKQNLLNMNLHIKEQENNEVIYSVQCFPLYSILLAIGQTTVDFFGLDVEGSEYKILKTIPWHKVDIKVRLFRFWEQLANKYPGKKVLHCTALVYLSKLSLYLSGRSKINVTLSWRIFFFVSIPVLLTHTAVSLLDTIFLLDTLRFQ